MKRDALMRVNGSIQPRTTFAAPVEFGLRTGETVILNPEEGSSATRLLALVESAVASQVTRENRAVTGTIQVLMSVDDNDKLAPVTSIPTFFTEVAPITRAIGEAYYGSVDATTDPATKSAVQPAALHIGSLLTDSNIPVVANACGFNRHTALLAQSGAGKSYALGVLIEELLQKTSARLVIIDPNGDFGLLTELPEASDLVIADGRDPKRYRIAVKTLTQRRSRGVVLNLNPLEPVLWEGIVSEALSLLWERRDEQRATIIIIDEAHNFAPADESNATVARTLQRIAAEGRKYGLWLMLASQRPQRLHSHVISQCDNLVLMRITSQLDLDHIAGSFGAVDRTMMQLATGFRSGSAMIVGRLVRSATLMKFRQRRLAEAGGDIALSWGCVPPSNVAG